MLNIQKKKIIQKKTSISFLPLFRLLAACLIDIYLIVY